MLVPAIRLSISAVRCINVPLPPWAMEMLCPDCFAIAMMSRSDLPVKDVDAARMNGEDARRVT